MSLATKSRQKQLVSQAQQGDADAFGQLFDENHQRLVKAITRVTDCREEAEDAVQEAFLVALRKLNTFRGDSEFYTWMFRIAFNIAVQAMRRRRPEVSIEQLQDVLENTCLDQGESPSDRLQRQERCQVLYIALAKLKDDSRTVLVLRHFRGLTYEQISQRLKLPIGTVRSRIHRSRLRLRKTLQEEGELTQREHRLIA